MAFTSKFPFTVKVDYLWRGTGVEDGVIAAFCAYFVFDLAYPPYIKNNLSFLQPTVLNITGGWKAPSIHCDPSDQSTILNMPRPYRCTRCRRTTFTLMKMV